MDIQTKIAVMAGLLPTPTVNGNYNRKGASSTSGDGLNTAIRGLLPIPIAGEGERGYNWRKRKKGQQMPLVVFMDTFASRECGSPTIHPNFYERLMGYPDGWTDVGRESKHSETL